MTRLTALAAALAAGMTSFAAYSQEAPELAIRQHTPSAPTPAAPQAEPQGTEAAQAVPVREAADYHAHAGDRGMHHLVEPEKAVVAVPDPEESTEAEPEAAARDEGEGAPATGRREVEIVAKERNTGGKETPRSPAATNSAASQAPAAAPTPSPRVQTAVAPVKGGRYGDIVARHASRHGIPVALAHAVISVESNYRADARGRAGEVGLMQIKPATARGLGYSGSVSALFNPETNIRYGMKYLAQAHRLGGGDTCQTILKYNAGHGARRMNPISAAYCSKVKRIMGGA